MWNFTVHVLLKPGLENFEHYFTSVWGECNRVLVWAFFGIAFLWDWFQSCGHCWVFQICWRIECSTFTALSFRIWNDSVGIPSPPLALFIVMLPKAHFTLHSRMSGSRWVITPSWLSGSWRPFLYSSSVYSCNLFLISFASVAAAAAKSLQSCPNSVRSHRQQPTRLPCPWDSPGRNTIQFLSFIVPISAWNVPLVSPIFLKWFLVFPILLFSSISLHWPLKKAFLSLLAILWNSAFRWVYLSFAPLLFTSLLFTAICKASSDSHFAFLHFFFLGMVLILVSYTTSRTFVHSSSGTLSIRSSPLTLFLTSTV